MTEISLSDCEFIKELNNTLDENSLNLLLLSQFKCNELKQEMIDKNICPDCGSNLILVSQGCESYEFLGKDIKEKQYILKCENCNMIYNDDN